ncbi:glutamate receptor ionotropic, kainate 2-like isoform X2 [Symsagittifera roscoffensis]|uniref:glutamate receptor ionotropic, kainate 2-like isoform X2 n=1 Tax=Symsagittifera roscoffensis TaxID=84072 RepID=UPI00307BF448
MILRQLSGDRRVTIYLLACLALIGWGHSAADKDQPKGTQDVQILNVGVLIEDSFLHRTFFNFALNRTNTEMARGSMPFRFRPLFRIVKNVNHVLAAVCDLLAFRDGQSKPGIVAIFAPKDSLFAAMVQDFGDSYSIPVLHYSQAFQPDRSPDSVFINLYPHFSTVKVLLRDTVDFYNWTKFAILFEDEGSFHNLELVMRDEENGNKSFMAWKLGTNDEKKAAMSLKQFRDANLFNVIVQTSQTDLRPLLDKMQKMQILSSKYHYIFNNFHSADFDLRSFLEGELNFTAFRLLDQTTDEFRRVENSFKWTVVNAAFARLVPPGYDIDNPITFDFALILDSMQLLRVGLREMLTSTAFQHDIMECNGDDFWRQGLTFTNFIRFASTMSVGLTGPLNLNGFGERMPKTVDVAQRVGEDIQIVGNWSVENGTNITSNSAADESLELLNNRTIRVTTIIQPPFTMLKEREDEFSTDSVQFEGYCVDLLEKMKIYMLKDGINFQYTLSLVKDGNYGSKQADGSWNGMVGELQRGEADLAVAPLTINYQRQDDIDFSTPYMNLGISILFRRREDRTPSIFSFLMPLHMNIWMYLIVAYIAMSFVLFVLSRFTPLERELPDDPTVPKLTLSNSFWFSAGAMMQQGSEIVPMATSTRIVAVGWYVFTLIIFCSYTANLAAFLTVTRMETPIQDVEDLAQQSLIKYGTLSSSSSYAFFQNSQLPTYVRMFQFMERHSPYSYVTSTQQGIERVQQEDYAFFMESTMIEYQVSQLCNLTQVGSPLDSKFYGIGLRKGSPYTPYVSKAILQLQDEGVLVKLKKKWWEERSRCSSESAGGGEDASALKMDSIGGIFYVLVGGTGIGFIVAIIEFVWKTRKNAKDNRTTFCNEMKTFFKRSYRRDEMFFGSMSNLFEKDCSEDDSKPSGAPSDDIRLHDLQDRASSLSLYTNSKASPVIGGNAIGRAAYHPPQQPFQVPGVGQIDPVRFGTLPTHSSTHSMIDKNDSSRRGGVNSANSTLKSSFNSSSNGAPRSGLKLRFSPTVDKQVYCQEHSSDQLSLNQSSNNSSNPNPPNGPMSNGQNSHGSAASLKSEAGTQTKNVRIKTDTDV